MRFTQSKLLFTAIVAMAALPATLTAQQGAKSQVNAVRAPVVETEATAAVEAAGIAAQLVNYGREHELPLALATAAHLLLHSGVHEVEREATEATGGSETADHPDAGPGMDPDAILAEASALAGGDATVESVIDNVQQLAEASAKGRTAGPGSTTDIVSAHSTDTYTIRFRGGEPARVVVQGDGDTDLDCFVYDENGYRIDSDLNYIDRCTLSWQPAWTGPFRIEIRNLGGVWNRYTLVTN